MKRDYPTFREGNLPSLLARIFRARCWRFDDEESLDCIGPGDAICVVAGIGASAAPSRAHAALSRICRAARRPFRYVDKGNLATVGRRYAVADIRGLKLSGLPAWIVWVVVHIYFLIGFRSRVLVLLEWAWAYFTYGRGARLIVETT